MFALARNRSIKENVRSCCRHSARVDRHFRFGRLTTSAASYTSHSAPERQFLIVGDQAVRGGLGLIRGSTIPGWELAQWPPPPR